MAEGGREKAVLVTGEISSLEHELGNDTVEGAVGISLPPENMSVISVHHSEVRAWRKIRSHFVPCTIHGSSSPSWESHHHRACYNNVSGMPVRSIAHKSWLDYMQGGGLGGTYKTMRPKGWLSAVTSK